MGDRTTKLGLAYALVAYAAFGASFIYFVAFVSGVVVPKTVDDGPSMRWPAALAIDLVLMVLWGLQHSVMARPGFKQWWTRLIPRPLERSTYVLIASVTLAGLCLAWVPVPGKVWSTPAPLARGLDVLAAFGWILAVWSSFAMDHFELAGLRQAWTAYTGRPSAPSELRQPLVYRVVRHPMQLGYVIGLWSASTMSVSRLVLATSMTLYILIGLHFEERDLVRHFGKSYEDYRTRVPKLLPWPRPRPPRSGPST